MSTLSDTTVVDLAMAGRFDDIREMFAPNLRTLVSAGSLRAVWQAELDQHGPVRQVGTPHRTSDGRGTVTIRIPVTFERDERTVVVIAGGTGQLLGIQLTAASSGVVAEWEPPDYARPAEFAEHDVTLGSGPLAVPGVLTVPHRPRPCPAVLLLSGSGPNDRDETIGSVKPFRDLAWGLAGLGVATLRFDKVTHAHPDQVAPRHDFTVTDEYLPDARAGMALLRGHDAIDPTRIFVLGHSLGGTVAGRVARAEPATAGLVILAGGAQPLHWSMVRQFRHLADAGPDPAAAAPVIAAVTKQAELVDSPDLAPSTPNSELPLGVPAPYWLDLRAYRPAEAAAAVGKPVLLLQGGRDYQATVADDLSIWRAALPDATVHVYPEDDHFFISGTGPQSPEEYEQPNHMDSRVIADIASWVHGQAVSSEA